MTADDSSGPAARAIADLAQGRAIVVIDDEFDHDGLLVFAAAHATAELMSTLVRHSTGLVYVPMAEDYLERLDLPSQVGTGAGERAMIYRVSVDAAQGVSTGISAADRARTARVLADPSSQPEDLTRPGHVLPTRAAPGGVLARAQFAEAAVDLVVLAGQAPAAVVATLVTTSGPVMVGNQLTEFAAEHALTAITVRQVIAFRQSLEADGELARFEQVTICKVAFRQRVYPSRRPGGARFAVHSLNDETGPDLPTMVHFCCPAADLLAVDGCDCRAKLRTTQAEIIALGRGAIVHVLISTDGEPPLTHRSSASWLTEIAPAMGSPTVSPLALDLANALSAAGIESIRPLADSTLIARALRGLPIIVRSG